MPPEITTPSASVTPAAAPATAAANTQSAVTATAPAAQPAADPGKAPAAGSQAPAAKAEAPAKSEAPALEKSLFEEVEAEDQALKDGDKKEGEAGKVDPKDQTGAPEAYQDFAMPEGVKANAEVMTEFKEVAKGLNLNQEQAQKLVDMQVKANQLALQQQQVQFNEQVRQMKEETKKALGPEYKKELAFAAKAINNLGTPELRKLIDQSGMGNHVEFAKFAVKVGKLISEGKFAEGKSAAVGAKTAAQLLYPNHS